MIYRKLKRTWSHNNMNYIPNFNKIFPELSKVNDEDIVNRFIELGLDFYTEEKVKVKWYIRITLIFALITWLLLFILLPFNFMITGTWGYNFGKKNYLANWFRMLHLE